MYARVWGGGDLAPLLAPISSQSALLFSPLSVTELWLLHSARSQCRQLVYIRPLCATQDYVALNADKLICKSKHYTINFHMVLFRAQELMAEILSIEAYHIFKRWVRFNDFELRV